MKNRFARLNRSLYIRVCLTTILAVAVSALLGFLVSNVYYHASLKPYNDAKLTGIAYEIQRTAELRPGDADIYLASAAALGYELYVTDGAGEERFYGRDFRQRDLDEAAARKVLDGGEYHGVAAFPNRPFITGFFDNRLSNTVGVPLTIGGKPAALFLRPDVILQFGELRSFFAMIGLLTVAFSIAIFLIATRYLVKPITRMTAATQQIADGRYGIELPTRRQDEIGQLAGHFMTMSRSLSRAEQSRREFVANVSHEIQSPLTSIQGFAQELAAGRLPDEERVRYAGIIGEESRRLSALGRQLLLLSSLDRMEDGLVRSPLNLRAEIRRAAEVLDWQLDEKGIALKLAVPDRLLVLGEATLLDQVWINLLSNAVKHIPEGRSISVAAEARDGWCEVRFADTGDGIPPEKLPLLFERFYRGDPARSGGGTGLGLAISRQIVQLHDGTISAESEPGQGSTFIVKLPRL
ncbi:HAMP domain-containing sensor histidine kinase [Saccharibacillus sp. CPCC 101409]|uniref:sensor histidine kinase n=1 Tax=Saccharibacillus sp. CPCC 101409 TaxID=3058041 RepID=UPI002673184A|nr:HAMP domain-containing sensor histidine kinase [Saccharibacillus sp. CPCC 101409]MDO3411961.1 HAMP domain-containing sensor histidine kinase [Saccharibacillus sp. CPCC 101409]